MAGTAVVIFNLGGPDTPDAVEPFLRNLFSDPAILRVPWPVRPVLARLISRRRARVARGVYDRLGGGSPILAETLRQRAALGAALGDGYRVFAAMRHWHPMADEVAHDVAAWGPDEVVLLPLYPQFSTTTTGSFLRAWATAAWAAGLRAPSSAVCCWPGLDGFADAMAAGVARAVDSLPPGERFRILFSAHGLPRRIADDGDPYAGQVQASVAAIAGRLGPGAADHVVCYQSRVGRLEWLRPYTGDEIRRAGAEGLSVVVVPVSFVSEHSETLVELDVEYAELAAASGVGRYVRVPAVGDDPAFISGLAALVRGARGPGAAPAGAACRPEARRCAALAR